MLTRYHSANLLLIVAIFTFLTGCASQNIQNKNSLLNAQQATSDLHHKSTVLQDAVEIREQLLTKEAVYLDSTELHQARLASFVEKLDQNTRVSEKDKITFLLSSIRNCSNEFLRNGTSYNSVQASEWLRWKMRHKQFRDNPIITGQDFVSRVSTRSNKSGDFYFFVKNGNQYKMGEILQNELSALEEAIRQKMTVAPSPMLETPDVPHLNYMTSVETPPTAGTQATSGSSLLLASAGSSPSSN